MGELCFALGLRAVVRQRRRARDPTTKRVATLEAFVQAGALGMKKHDRRRLARRQFDRKLFGRRSNSSLPTLTDLVIGRPALSVGMIAHELRAPTRNAQDLVAELELREMSGRGR